MTTIALGAATLVDRDCSSGALGLCRVALGSSTRRDGQPECSSTDATGGGVR